jgi:hypothetical protein
MRDTSPINHLSLCSRLSSATHRTRKKISTVQPGKDRIPKGQGRQKQKRRVCQSKKKIASSFYPLRKGVSFVGKLPRNFQEKCI